LASGSAGFADRDLGAEDPTEGLGLLGQDRLASAPLADRAFPIQRPKPSMCAHSRSHRERHLDTRVGTLELEIPKLRQGSYYPDWWRPGHPEPVQVPARVRTCGWMRWRSGAGRPAAFVNVACVVATGVNADGYREILGLAYSPARTAPAGPASCATWSPAAFRGGAGDL
jgi:Transposase, Mutator family